MRFGIFILCMSLSWTILKGQSTISEIDQLTNHILDQVDKFEMSEESFENGSRTSYHQDGELRLLQVQENGDIVKTVRWFFLKKQLIETETNWVKQGTDVVLFYEKTYHENGRMLAVIGEHGQFENANTNAFRQKEKDIQSYAKSVLEKDAE